MNIKSVVLFANKNFLATVSVVKQNTKQNNYF